MHSSYIALYRLLGVSLSLIALVLQHKHLLNVLLCLEVGIISLFLLLFSYSQSFYRGYVSLILITLRACEASLGLSVLVSMIRACGNDYVNSFSRQKC